MQVLMYCGIQADGERVVIIRMTANIEIIKTFKFGNSNCCT